METTKVCEEVSIETSTEEKKKRRKKVVKIAIVTGAGLALGGWVGYNRYRTGSFVGGLKLTGKQFMGGVKRVGSWFGKKQETNNRPQNQNRPEREPRERNYERPQYRPGNGERKQQNV